jgi:hypothetical protein
MLSCHKAAGRENLGANRCFCCIKLDPISEGTRQKITALDAANADRGPIILIGWEFPAVLEPSTQCRGSRVAVRLAGTAGGGSRQVLNANKKAAQRRPDQFYMWIGLLVVIVVNVLTSQIPRHTSGGHYMQPFMHISMKVNPFLEFVPIFRRVEHCSGFKIKFCLWHRSIQF